MPNQSDDQEMPDAAAGVEQNTFADGEYVIEKQRLRLVWELRASKKIASSLTSAQLPGSTETAASFELEKEDHTLGNALRYMITKKYHFTVSNT